MNELKIRNLIEKIEIEKTKMKSCFWRSKNGWKMLPLIKRLIFSIFNTFILKDIKVDFFFSASKKSAVRSKLKYCI